MTVLEIVDSDRNIFNTEVCMDCFSLEHILSEIEGKGYNFIFISTTSLDGEHARHMSIMAPVGGRHHYGMDELKEEVSSMFNNAFVGF